MEAYGFFDYAIFLSSLKRRANLSLNGRREGGIFVCLLPLSCRDFAFRHKREACVFPFPFLEAAEDNSFRYGKTRRGF